MFGRETDVLHLAKGEIIHKIAIWYESDKEDLSHLLIVPALQMMDRYILIVVHNDIVDIYYLLIFVSMKAKNDLSLENFC